MATGSAIVVRYKFHLNLKIKIDGTRGDGEWGLKRKHFPSPLGLNSILSYSANDLFCLLLTGGADGRRSSIFTV